MAVVLLVQKSAGRKMTATPKQLAEWQAKLEAASTEQRKHPVDSPKWFEYGELVFFYDRRISELSGRFR